MKKEINCFHTGGLFLMCLLCSLLLLPATLSARQDSRRSAGRDYTAIAGEILNRKPEHPYLLFDSGSKQAMLDRVKNDPEYAQIMDLLLQQGRRIMLNTTEPQKVFNDPASRYYQLPSW